MTLATLLSPHAHGIFPGVKAEDYHAGPGVSFGHLAPIGISPAHFIAALDAPRPEQEPEHFVVGRLAHEMILEGHCSLPANVALRPDGLSFRTKVGKDWRDAQTASGKSIIEAEQWQALPGMAAAIQQHSVASMVFRQGQPEVSIYTPCENMGVNLTLRIRLDWMADDHDGLADLKTIGEEATDYNLAKAIKRSNLLARQAWYFDIANAAREVFKYSMLIFVEKAPPHGVRCIKLTEAQLAHGREIYRSYLHALCRCINANRWPAYERGVEELDLPNWAMKDEG